MDRARSRLHGCALAESSRLGRIVSVSRRDRAGQAASIAHDGVRCTAHMHALCLCASASAHTSERCCHVPPPPDWRGEEIFWRERLLCQVCPQPCETVVWRTKPLRPLRHLRHLPSHPCVPRRRLQAAKGETETCLWPQDTPTACHTTWPSCVGRLSIRKTCYPTPGSPVQADRTERG